MRIGIIRISRRSASLFLKTGYSWSTLRRSMEIPPFPDVNHHCLLSLKMGIAGLLIVRLITGHFKGPSSHSSELHHPNGYLLSSRLLRFQLRPASQEVYLSDKMILRTYAVLRRILIEKFPGTDEIL